MSIFKYKRISKVMPINNAINAPFIVAGFGSATVYALLSGVALAAMQMSKKIRYRFIRQAA
jgi:hypothetical protein